MNQLKQYWTLFFTFFKIGAFTIGGGYAMLPLIQREVVEKHGWIDEADMLDIVAIAESTPGPIAINSSTFVGARVAGFWGSFFATLGTVIPSFVIIVALSKILGMFMEIEAVAFAFNGIRAGVIALIVKALIGMAKKCPRDLFSISLVCSAFVIVLFFGVNVLYVILGGAMLGLAAAVISKRREVKK